jgi:uncharacterized protein (TIGR03905 family)
MSKHIFYPQGVCSQQITFELNDDNTISNVRFSGGCNGNLKAIAKLVQGKDAAEIAQILAGNDCAGRGTSCADQLSRALTEALSKR